MNDEFRKKAEALNCHELDFIDQNEKGENENENENENEEEKEELKENEKSESDDSNIKKSQKKENIIIKTKSGKRKQLNEMNEELKENVSNINDKQCAYLSITNALIQYLQNQESVVTFYTFIENEVPVSSLSFFFIIFFVFFSKKKIIHSFNQTQAQANYKLRNQTNFVFCVSFVCVYFLVPCVH